MSSFMHYLLPVLSPNSLSLCVLKYLFLLQTSSSTQLTKAMQALISDFADGFEFLESEAKTNESEKIDALEVISRCILF